MVKGGIGGSNTQTGAVFEGKVDLITLQEKALSIWDDLEWMKLNTATMKEKIDFEKSAKYPMIGAHLEYGFNDNKFSIDDTQDYYVIATGLEYKIFDANIINNEIEKKYNQVPLEKYYLYPLIDTFFGKYAYVGRNEFKKKKFGYMYDWFYNTWIF